MEPSTSDQSKTDAVDTLKRCLRQAQERYELFVAPASDTPITVVVGVSGGADSVCLLHLLNSSADAMGLSLHVAHLDHNLRPTSAADARFVAELAGKWGLPLHRRRLSAAEMSWGTSGMEAAARRARYTYLATVARSVTPPGQLPTVAVGHHADDQVETILMHLLRGSGLDGLGGMRWVTLFPDRWDGETAQPSQKSAPQGDLAAQIPVRIVRPLLLVDRQQIRRYLHQCRLAWREDETNQDTAFLRNRLRHDLIPILTRISPNLTTIWARSAQVLAGEASRSTRVDEETLGRLRLNPKPAHSALDETTIVLDLVAFQELELAAQRGVMRRTLARLAPHTEGAGFETVEALVWQVRQAQGAGGPHPIGADLAWSLAAAVPPLPARLALHRVDTLPFPAHHPFLDAPWRQRRSSLALEPGVPVDLPDGWRLQIADIARTRLPDGWRHNYDPWQVFLDRDQISTPVLCSPQPGQRFAPLGMAGRHKTLGDFFTDRKIPKSLRTGWPLVLNGHNGEVVWVCGLQMGHTARIREQTDRILWLAWQAASPGAPAGNPDE